MSTATPTTSNHTVVGMTCAHCAYSVRKEVGKIDGVTNVTVDLDSGQVTVESTQTINAGDFAAAVDEAGYEVGS